MQYLDTLFHYFIQFVHAGSGQNTLKFYLNTVFVSTLQALTLGSAEVFLSHEERM